MHINEEAAPEIGAHLSQSGDLGGVACVLLRGSFAGCLKLYALGLGAVDLIAGDASLWILAAGEEVERVVLCGIEPVEEEAARAIGRAGVEEVSGGAADRQIP